MKAEIPAVERGVSDTESPMTNYTAQAYAREDREPRTEEARAARDERDRMMRFQVQSAINHASKRLSLTQTARNDGLGNNLARPSAGAGFDTRRNASTYET